MERPVWAMARGRSIETLGLVTRGGSMSRTALKRIVILALLGSSVGCFFYSNYLFDKYSSSGPAKPDARNGPRILSGGRRRPNLLVPDR